MRFGGHRATEALHWFEVSLYGDKSLDTIDYDKMIQNALRSVVRCALKQVAEHGLPGQHHFYITFRTDRRDVEMPEHVRNEHPNEVTIVMQHQFWNLEVEED